MILAIIKPTSLSNNLKIITQITGVILFLIYGFQSFAQEVDITGKVLADGEVEGIHIINKTANKFTITDQNGVFIIPAKLNDTITFSSIKYKPQVVIVNEKVIQSKYLLVSLEETIYELDEVLVGRFLTGDLRSDILNAKIKKDINFYDVGIPGYTGRQKTQSERRLFEADAGKFVYFYGVGFAINIHKILNRISGRTKQMKNRVRIEALDVCMNRAKSEFSESLFGDFEIEEHQKLDFFYFVSEDPKFFELCKSNNSMEMFEFLLDKLVNYQDNQEEIKD